MNLAKFSIEKNRIVFLVLGAIIAMGLSIFSQLPRDSMPLFTVRIANIITELPGAGPERIEALITDKIEKVVQELPELKQVVSTSRTGISIVEVTLVDEVKPDDLQAVWDRLRRKIEAVDGLPQNVFPYLDADGYGDTYGIVVGLVTDEFSYSEMKDYTDEIRNDLIELPDAAKVVLGGVQEERVFIEFEDTRLREYGLSAFRLQQLIAATNILISGGEVNLNEERIILEPTGNFNSFEDIGDMLLPVGPEGKQLVRLKDITTIKKGYITPSNQKVSVNGKNAISLHINLKEDANIINLGENVDRIVAKWEKKLPLGIDLARISSLDGYIANKVDNFVDNLIQSIGIVLLVMLLFLGFRTGTIIASLIPIVTIMTILIMAILGVGLNQVTLASLIIALGMMVDNAIVVAETILVKMEQGLKPKQAAIEACSELFTPLLISTLTTSAAFLAFFMSPTIMGDIVGPIFVVVSIALLCSWLIALSTITMFCVLFLKVNTNKQASLVDKVIMKLKQYYKNVILWALSYKAIVILSVFAAFVLALVGFTKIPFLFFPDSDRNMVTVDINLPSGTKIETTAALVKELEQYFQDSLMVDDQRTEGIASWSTYIGQGPESYDIGYTQDEANPSYAHIIINTSSFSINKEMIKRIDNYGFQQFPNADIKIKALSADGGGIPVEIKIIGKDADELAEIALSVKKKLADIPGTKNIRDDWGPKSKKFLIKVDQSRALSAGVSSQDIAISLQTTLDGFQTGEYREEDKSIPILIRNNASNEQTMASLETVSIYAQSTGKSIPLLQVATIEPQWQYGKIRRYNLNRTVSITCALRENGNAAAITADITPWLNEEMKQWPEDFRYEFGGDEKQTAENMGSVIQYLPLSGLIIVLLLIIQFNSFRKMSMIVSTIPLALIGAVAGLLVFREPFGFMPFLGVISLAGIVINNAIVLIDRIEIEQHELGRKIQDAIISACLQRFRPILLATFTTVLGLIPLYWSGGELWEGMAISIMIGLLFGTVITLIFIPSLYSILYRVNYKNYQFNNDLIE